MKKGAFRLFALAIVLVAAGAGGELLVRLAGHEAWSPVAVDRNEPTMSRFDPVLGWVAIPGSHVVSPYHPAGAEIHYTFLEDGSRATSEVGRTGPYDLVLLGGSYTQGRAVSDWDTFGWKLQSAFPELKVGNFGVGAYGTYQSLLMLRSLYQRGLEPEIVIYGLIDHHQVRNIAHFDWLMMISRSLADRVSSRAIARTSGPRRLPDTGLLPVRPA